MFTLKREHKLRSSEGLSGSLQNNDRASYYKTKIHTQIDSDAIWFSKSNTKPWKLYSKKKIIVSFNQTTLTETTKKTWALKTESNC